MALLRNIGKSTLPFTANPTVALSEGLVRQDQNLGLVRTFIPTWSGFSSAPVGSSFSYVDMGALVIMWLDNSATGSSDSTSMSWFTGSVPENIRPVDVSRTVSCIVFDDGDAYSGAVTINVNGSAIFFILNSAGFTPSGSKGMIPGWIIMYAK